jgi:hypothetical protein
MRAYCTWVVLVSWLWVSFWMVTGLPVALAKAPLDCMCEMHFL